MGLSLFFQEYGEVFACHAGDADEKHLAAAMEDVRATLGAVFRALCEDRCART